MNALFALAAADGLSRAGCVLLALFIGSVVYEVLSIPPRRQWIALVGAVLCALLVFFLMSYLTR
jgi:hypothetical protein